jgi:Ca2+/H+ antiporter
MGKTRARQMIAGVVCAALLGMVSMAAAGGGLQYEVTITNLTRGQTFTPILVASHEKGVCIFMPGFTALGI